MQKSTWVTPCAPVFSWVSPCTCRDSININTLEALGAASAAVACTQQNGAGHEACWQQQQRTSGAARKLAQGVKPAGNSSSMRAGQQE